MENDNNNENSQKPMAGSTENPPRIECNAESLPPIPSGPEDEQKDLSLLPANHPIMQRFQQMLKIHLNHMKIKISNEVAEYKRQLVLKEAEYTEEGVKLNHLLQIIKRQSDQIEEKAKEAEEAKLRRIDMENKAEELEKKYETRLKECKEQKRQHQKLLVELGNTKALEAHIHNWTDEVEDELKNAQRIVHRGNQLRKNISQEKMKEDMLSYSINVEVKKLENELQILSCEVLDLRNINQGLRDNIQDANTDLQVLETEHKRLIQAWNEVIVEIGHRDKFLKGMAREMNNEKETIELNERRIEAIKKQIGNEIKINKKLESFKKRLQYDCGNVRSLCQEQSDNLEVSKNKMVELPAFITQNWKDLKEAIREGNALESEIRQLQLKIDKQCAKKLYLEEHILKEAQEQLVSDKASQYRLKLLKEARSTHRLNELNLAQRKSQLAEALMDMERYKHERIRESKRNDKLKSSLSDADERFKVVNAELVSLDKGIEIKLYRVAKITGRIEKLQRSGVELGVTITMKKINEAERALHAGEEQIRECQEFWLMLQNHYVNLSDKCNHQRNEIQIIQKQLYIIKQKSLKVDNNLAIEEAVSKKLDRDISAALSKLVILDGKMFKAVKQHNNEEKECEMEHALLLNKLKDDEREVLHLEGEINKLEDEIREYKNLIMDKNREALTLKSKYKLIEETLHWRKEQNLETELIIIKREIQRMKIRYQQLLRVQNRFNQQFHRSIKNREQVYESALMKISVEKKAQPLKSGSLLLQNRLKRTLAEIKKKTDAIATEESKHKRLQTEVKRLSDELEKQKINVAEIEQKLHRGALEKQLNLQRIVRKQNAAKSYRGLDSTTSAARRRPRSAEELDQLMQKERKINDDLKIVLETLINEFPHLKQTFDKLLYTLQD